MSLEHPHHVSWEKMKRMALGALTCPSPAFRTALQDRARPVEKRCSSALSESIDLSRLFEDSDQWPQ